MLSFLYMSQPTIKKPNSHLGAGLAAGAILGLAAGFFLQSRKGKVFVADAKKKSQLLQKQVMKMLTDAESLTKERYEDIVDKVMKHYTSTKEIASKEIPEVQKHLLSQWKTIESQLQQAGIDSVAKAEKTKNKIVRKVKKIAKA